jgi:asparagine synthase (glutamine-hydrolysing)
MGFSVPLASWFRHEIKDIAQHHLIDNAKGLKSIFNPNEIKNMWFEHQSQSADHGAVLWSMLR